MTATRALKLTCALQPTPAIQPLIDGAVAAKGVEIEQLKGVYYVDIFRRMARNRDFDIASMSLVSYLCAREYGVAITGLPLLLSHRLPHEGILYNVDSGIKEPKDLEGKRVGTRTYTVTPGTIHRGLLKEEFGVDLDSITWVAAEPEHVPQVTPYLPKNVIAGTGETGADHFPSLVAGDLQAGIAGVNPNNSEAPNVKPLFPDPDAMDKAYFERTGVLIPNSIPVVKTELLEENPWLARALYDVFAESKAVAGTKPSKREQAVIGDIDPLLFGFSANRKGFEKVIEFAYDQHIIAKPMKPEDIFPIID